MSKSLSLAFSILLAAAACHAAGSPAAPAPNDATEKHCPTCTVRDIEGCFAVWCSGEIVAGPFAGPYATTGTVNCDRNGFCSASTWTSIGGNVVPTLLEGTATVASDCTGSITYDITIGGEPAGQTTAKFVILDHGQRVRGIVADPGWAVTCELVER